MSNDTPSVVQYVLSSLKRAAENAYSWSLTPNEAGVLVAEVERLRAERAAVVAFLREGDTVCMECGDRATLDLAYRIERGEHRREGEP